MALTKLLKKHYRLKSLKNCLLIDAGYQRLGSAPAKGKRIKVWWRHDTHRRIESIYSPDEAIAITAYHIEEL